MESLDMVKAIMDFVGLFKMQIADLNTLTVMIGLGTFGIMTVIVTILYIYTWANSTPRSYWN